MRSPLIRPIVGAACAALALACAGCLLDARDAKDPEPAVQAKTGGNPGVPLGCWRVWSTVAMDSVLYCPDPKPPSPKKN